MNGKIHGRIDGIIDGKINPLGAKLKLKPPTNLVLSIVSNTQINLSWTLGDATKAHRIYISTDNVNFTEKGTVLAGVSAYNATGLTNYTRYYFRVVSYLGSLESNPAIADTFDFVIPFPVTAGLFDFSWDNSNGRLWMFPDGTTSTAERPAKTLASNGTVYLYSNVFAGNYRLNDNLTNARYLGSLADLQGKFTFVLSLNICPNITGSLADLQGKLTYFLDLGSCPNITGIYTPTGSALPTITYLDNTGISTADMDQTLINYANQAVAINKNNGTFRANEKTRTAASDAAVATLTGKGWTVSGLTKI